MLKLAFFLVAATEATYHAVGSEHYYCDLIVAKSTGDAFTVQPVLPEPEAPVVTSTDLRYRMRADTSDRLYAKIMEHCPKFKAMLELDASFAEEMITYPLEEANDDISEIECSSQVSAADRERFERVLDVSLASLSKNEVAFDGVSKIPFFTHYVQNKRIQPTLAIAGLVDSKKRIIYVIGEKLVLLPGEIHPPSDIASIEAQCTLKTKQNAKPEYPVEKFQMLGKSTYYSELHQTWLSMSDFKATPILKAGTVVLSSTALRYRIRSGISDTLFEKIMKHCPQFKTLLFVDRLAQYPIQHATQKETIKCAKAVTPEDRYRFIQALSAAISSLEQKQLAISGHTSHTKLKKYVAQNRIRMGLATAGLVKQDKVYYVIGDKLTLMKGWNLLPESLSQIQSKCSLTVDTMARPYQQIGQDKSYYCKSRVYWDWFGFSESYFSMEPIVANGIPLVSATELQTRLQAKLPQALYTNVLKNCMGFQSIIQVDKSFQKSSMSYDIREKIASFSDIQCLANVRQVDRNRFEIALDEALLFLATKKVEISGYTDDPRLKQQIKKRNVALILPIAGFRTSARKLYYVVGSTLQVLPMTTVTFASELAKNAFILVKSVAVDKQELRWYF